MGWRPFKRVGDELPLAEAAAGAQRFGSFWRGEVPEATEPGTEVSGGGPPVSSAPEGAAPLGEVLSEARANGERLERLADEVHRSSEAGPPR